MNKPLIHDDMTADQIKYRAAYVWGKSVIEEHGIDHWLRSIMPEMVENKDEFPADHPIQDLIRRWDPELQDFRPDLGGSTDLDFGDPLDFLK